MRIRDWSSDVCSSDRGAQRLVHLGKFVARGQEPAAHAVEAQRRAELRRARRLCATGEHVGGVSLSGADRRAARALDLAPETAPCRARAQGARRSEEHTSELQALMRTQYAVFCRKKKQQQSNK